VIEINIELKLLYDTDMIIK